MIKKTVLLILIVFSPAFAGPDINGDDIVNFEDFAIFANSWQTADANCDFNTDGIVNYKDLAIFADVWLDNIFVFRTLITSAGTGGTITTPGVGTYIYIDGTLVPIVAEPSANYAFVNWTGSVADVNSADTTITMDANYSITANFEFVESPPVIEDCNFIGYAFITKEITLSAAAGSLPILDYIIVSGVNDVNAYLQDPASGVGKLIKFPHRLRNRGNTVWLAADNNETFTFKWKVSDGVNDSNDANCTVAVLENPKDCLSFDGQGWLDIPDSNYFDIDNKGIGFCFKTRKPFCGVLKKREAGKAGYEVDIVSGRIVVSIYDSNGIVAKARSEYRYDNGLWTNCVFALNSDKLELYIFKEPVNNNWYTGGKSEIFMYDTREDGEDNSIPVPAGSYINDCNLIIGKSNSSSYQWEIDAVRSYVLDFNDLFRTLSAVESRETVGESTMFVPLPLARFMINEGSGNTITNDKDPNLVGTISDPNHVRWTPYNWSWMDYSVLRRR
jgi:hypothetical protein